MLSRSLLKDQISRSPLSGQATIRPKGQRKGRPLMFNLMLTSLIDAFSILVIFLLMNTSDVGANLQSRQGMELPAATVGKMIESGTIIRFESGRFFVDDKFVETKDLTRVLLEKRKQMDPPENQIYKLIVQSDRKTNFGDLNPIILAGSQAGFQQFKFAVTPNETRQKGI